MMLARASLRQVAVLFWGWGLAAFAEEQVWDDGAASDIWSTNEANWVAGAVWTNGNSAVFSGAGGTLAGETVDISSTVTVANVSFLTNGYVIADADKDGLFSLAGLPSVITVSGGCTGALNVAVGGSGGLTKMGPGVLSLMTTNSFAGVTTVGEGILRLAPGVLLGLGATGAGNETVVLDGATLDVNSAFTGNLNEDITIVGSGVGGIGALVNMGPTDYYNVGYRNLTLSGDATIGVYRRFDMSGSGTYTGNGFTLTKIGGAEMAISRAVNNSPIVINAGTYTIQFASALGSTDYPTTLNGGKLQAWGTYTIGEALIVNGGTLSSSGTGTQTFKLTGTLTLNSNVVVQTETSANNALELAGVMEGGGGFTRNGGGFVYVTGDANTYSGPTMVNGGTKLWVGRDVGGTGVLGTGFTTNSGTLYANSASLGSGTVVNNGGSLYLNPTELSAGRIVNAAGTVYGTSVVQAANGVVNGGTWHAYSGSFGASAVTNASGGTLNLYTNQLIYGQFANGGTLSLWQSMTLADPITFIGGTLYVNDLSNTLYVTAPVTLAGNASFSGTGSSVTEVSGVLSGPGGIIRSGDGWCTITGDANDYTGPTIVNGGKWLFVGKPGGVSGGRLGPGAVTNNGTLYFDSPGSYTTFGGISGGGVTGIRYGGAVTLDGGGSTNGVWHVAHGSLALTNGAALDAPAYDMTVANRMDVRYVVAPTNCPLPTNVCATVTVNSGCALTVKSITFGNGGDLAGGTMTGILNQVGGTVRTMGAAAEGNGVRLGHYPQTRSFYNMMGGTLIVENNWDLGCATDGQGWFNMTGGEVFTKRVMLNERDSTGGYGRLTVSGGVLNVGSLTGSDMAISNAICADLYAPYLVELGGAGGTIRAVTNLWIPARATLYGSGSDAITLDSREWTISMTNVLSGAGGLNKAGSGTLLLSGKNSFTGLTQVAEGTLLLGGAGALTNVPLAVASGAALDLGGFAVVKAAGLSGGGSVSNGTLTVEGRIEPGDGAIGTLSLALANAAPGGLLTVDVATNGTCDVLQVTGDLDLAGMTLEVADPGQLNTHQDYTVITFSGALAGSLQAVNLPSPWYIMHERVSGRVVLSSKNGTLMRVK